MSTLLTSRLSFNLASVAYFTLLALLLPMGAALALALPWIVLTHEDFLYAVSSFRGQSAPALDNSTERCMLSVRLSMAILSPCILILILLG